MTVSQFAAFLNETALDEHYVEAMANPNECGILADGSGGYAANYDPLYDPSDPAATPPDRFETLAAAGVGVLPFPRDEESPS